VPPVDRRELAAIFVGGAAGALLRVWLGTTFSGGAPNWPWLTFAINVSGSFALAYFATRLGERLPQSSYRRPFLGTGFCGAYTTFSTMMVEVLKIIDAHRYGLAAGYALASIAAGYLAIWTASAAVRRTRRLA
jgi:fluoride exporter